MKPSIRFLTVFFIVSGLVSCDNADPVPAPVPVAVPVPVSVSDLDPVPYSLTITYNGFLNGAREVPSNTSTATGNAVLVFNTTTKIFSLTITYIDLTPIEGQMQIGVIGIDGQNVFPLMGQNSPITYTSPVLTTAQETDLKEGRYYVNLYSASFPDGEIRGQLDNSACEGCWDY
jgi:hypothetical protein